jgi:anchored repeat ABC transporter substrate-binding protein
MARLRTHTRSTWRALRALCAAVVSIAVVGSCARGPVLSAADDRVQVVTTNGILKDLAANVAGERAVVTSLVPDGADPHSYEPTPRSIRDVVYADLAFSNYLLLEQQSIIKALDANLRDGVPNLSVAEGAVKYAAEIIPLVENAVLDTIWLGLRVHGTGERFGADRSSEVLLSAVGVDGPGRLSAYLTESFGNPDVAFDSGDGFDASDGHRDDTTRLPPAAHTHMSWAFDEPGVYRLAVSAKVAVRSDEPAVDVATGEITFAVGIDPHSVPGMEGAVVLDHGHTDVTVDLDRGELVLLSDRDGGDDGHGDGGHGDDHGAAHERIRSDPARAVIAVPVKALAEVPGHPDFRFLGDAGDPVYQLPQAVLGRHVHGEIDPHLWQDVGNAVAYVQLIRDALIEVDPPGARTYRTNADRYIAELWQVDDRVRATIDEIPEARRHLVTTHDAFAYLGKAYGVEISGFVTSSPSSEPSLADRRRLQRTVEDLQIGAVFLEPNLRSRSSTLREVAGDAGIDVCPIHGDSFHGEIDTYTEMMMANARSLRDCLAPAPEGEGSHG